MAGWPESGGSGGSGAVAGGIAWLRRRKSPAASPPPETLPLWSARPLRVVGDEVEAAVTLRTLFGAYAPHFRTAAY